METRPDGIFDEDNRRPTNKGWIYPFIFVIIAFIGLAIWASISTGPTGLISIEYNPEDIQGSNCGFDSDVLDKPIQFFVDERDCHKSPNTSVVTKCNQPWICVKECPKGDFDASSCNANNFNQLKEKLFCQSEKLRASINTCSQLKNAVQHNDCVGWYENTYELFSACISRQSSRKTTDEVAIMELNLSVGEIILSLIPSFLYAMLIAGVVSFFFILTLKWSAGFIFWGFVALIILCFVGLIVLIVVIGLTGGYKNTDKETVMIVVGIQSGVISILLIVFLVLVYCFRRKIKCGIEIVKESSHAVCASIGAILFPLLPFLLRAGVVIGTVYILVMAFTLVDNEYTIHGLGKSGGDCSCNGPSYEVGNTCLPEKFNMDCKTSDGGICTTAVCKIISQKESVFSTPILIITIMISMWIVAFIQANSKMILAHVYGNWYWNWNREFIPTGSVGDAMGKIFKNHIGTAAFGGFVVMMCQFLKGLISKRDNSNVRGIGAIIALVVVEIIRCLAQAILDLIEFVSNKAFVICAIMGTGFWDSVKTVSTIMLKDIPLVVATESVGDIILFVCKFVAAILSAALFYFTSPYDGEHLWISIVMTILIFVFAYDLASVLLTAYDIAIDTLLVCTLQDYMHSKMEKAYFKSQTLNELLLKKDAA